MNPKTKKYLIAGAIGIITIAGAAAYLQYKKLMDYTLKFKAVKPKKISLTELNFDIIVDFINKSNVNFVIESQIYNVYINDVFVSKLENSSPTTIKANSTSLLGLNVKLNPKHVFSKIGVNAVNLITKADKTIVKVDCKLRVKLWFFTVNIPYVYVSSLKELMTPVPTTT